MERDVDQVEQMLDRFGYGISADEGQILIVEGELGVYECDTLDGVVDWLVCQGDDLVVH